MRIGIMADTHDCLPLVERAVEVLNREGVGLVLHAGDYVAPFTLRVLEGLDAPVIGVFGNNDGDRELLRKTASEGDIVDLRGDGARIEDGDLSIGLVHGHDTDLLTTFMESGDLDVLVSGHTHHPLIGRHGRTLMINPGEICGYLTGTPTLAVLDTRTKEAHLVRL
ncbi:metallophosphoesterase [Methanofollis aquaemaris]|uniref:Phosphoesterase n=1 Tax=Methanofollis aquaemaris TaxID=126734 RepID=A0A8A3S860_9EURY|nr:metallophosphoesterase [Methanofollis aquaemaris]QSZ67776.1 metallophosphoesterase [Methanofollis aquaemaris]